MATSKQIINVDPNGGWWLDTKSLNQILLRDEIKNLPVVVISIVGTYRQGKSFILNFFLLFLNQMCREKKAVKHWFNSDDDVLSGFAWKKSTQRETLGVVMWSEVFISQLPSGEKVAIVLLDTQGTHDNSTNLNDFAAIFALSTLFSSVQIYNIKEKINQSHLLSLKDFLDYGNLINEANSEGTPFQTLLFLIRDWINTEEFDFGEVGGNKYLESQVGVSPNDGHELTVLKKSVQRFFNKIYGFLLPEPGPEVVKKATNNLKEIDEEFKTYVKLLVENILKPENLVVKKINGQIVKVSDFRILIENYCEIFQSGQMPRVESIFQATAKTQLQSAVDEHKQLYKNSINFDANPDSKAEDADVFNCRHMMAKLSTVDKFDKMKTMGDAQTKQKYRTKLEESIDEIYGCNQSINQTKLKRDETRKKEEALQKELSNMKVTLDEDKKRSIEQERKLKEERKLYQEAISNMKVTLDEDKRRSIEHERKLEEERKLYKEQISNMKVMMDENKKEFVERERKLKEERQMYNEYQMQLQEQQYNIGQGLRMVNALDAVATVIGWLFKPTE